MPSLGEQRVGSFRIDTPAIAVVLAIAAVSLLIAVLSLPARAQSFNIIHAFTGGADGGYPLGGLSMDSAGNFYGTTEVGGQRGPNCGDGCGVVFKITKKNGQWFYAPLYSLKGGNDGRYPFPPVTVSPDGSLYGVTYLGGANDAGIVFRLQPPLGICKSSFCPWRETIIYSFKSGCPPCDATAPGGQLLFDQLGNIYGTSYEGGDSGVGTVYQLKRTNGIWTEAVIHSFDYSDGAYPLAGLIFGHDGNLYGTTTEDNVFQLKPSGDAWNETVLHTFSGPDGSLIQAGLVPDAAGNLYGAASEGGSSGFGTVFELMPSGDTWNFNVLYSFLPRSANQPLGTMAMDAAGNLYGTGRVGGDFGVGEVFKLERFGSSWFYHTLHTFTGGSDGAYPYGNVTLDAAGNLYGTANGGGGICVGLGCGVVWIITPN